MAASTSLLLADEEFSDLDDYGTNTLSVGSGQRAPHVNFDKDITKKCNPSNVVPDSIRSAWYSLKNSRLPETLFADLVNCAVYCDKMPGMEEISANAIDDFVTFWKKLPCVGVPVLTVTPQGGIALEWFHSPEHVLAIMFPGDGYLIFSLFDGTSGLDGAERREKFGDAIAMLTARNANPFEWSEMDA